MTMLMKITSERRQFLSAAVILAAVLYFVADEFSRGTVHGLAWGSMMLWNTIVYFLFYLRWWLWRPTAEAAIKKPPLRRGILVLSTILASVVASAVLLAVGVSLLEQESLGLQVLGGVLFAIVYMIAPAWSLWFYGWARGAWQAPGSDQASVGQP